MRHGGKGYDRERKGENFSFAQERNRRPTPCCFLLKVGMQKVRRRAQKPRRHINLDVVSKVLRGSAIDNQTAETRCFVFDFLFCGKPVKLFKKTFSMLCSESKYKHRFRSLVGVV